MKRKKIIAIIGGGAQTCTQEACDIAIKVGELLIDNGFRVISGGYGGIMEAVSKGARSSKKHQDGDIIGVIQTLNTNEANEYCDIVIATGMSYARNQIITASADAVVAIGGGSGTLSEIAFSWQLNKPLFAFKIEGWSGNIAGKSLDSKRDDTIIGIETPEQLIKQLITILK